MAEPAAAPATAAVTAMAAPPPKIVAQSKPGQGLCADNRQYHYQARKLEDGTLCTHFQWEALFLIDMGWDPKWNAEAKKRYCPTSTKDPCFLKE
ncbi:MAG: hypothetical protein AB1942_03675 [Pseudomonadota bacterium]